MTLPRAAAIVGVAAVMAAVAAVVITSRPARRIPGPATPAAAAAPAAVPAAGVGRKIKAHLFYVSDDGTRLVSLERDVPFAEGAEQAREIVAAQIAPVAEPLVSAVPPGTSLRSIFVTDRGEAYVDLSREFSAAHPGGTLNELLTVYSIVDALTANLPAVHAVQILVDGKQMPTLAGHVDLRHPLGQDSGLVLQ
jgi:hypothetical protein